MAYNGFSTFSRLLSASNLSSDLCYSKRGFGGLLDQLGLKCLSSFPLVK